MPSDHDRIFGYNMVGFLVKVEESTYELAACHLTTTSDSTLRRPVDPPSRTVTVRRPSHARRTVDSPAENGRKLQDFKSPWTRDTVGAVRYSRFVGSDRKHIVGFRPVYGFRRRTELFDAAVGLG